MTAPNQSPGDDNRDRVADWIKQVVTLDSAAIGLVVAFVDPARMAAGRWLAGLSVLVLAASIVAGVLMGLLNITFSNGGYRGREATLFDALSVIHVLGFLGGFVLLAIFGFVNLV